MTKLIPLLSCWQCWWSGWSWLGLVGSRPDRFCTRSSFPFLGNRFLLLYSKLLTKLRLILRVISWESMLTELEQDFLNYRGGMTPPNSLVSTPGGLQLPSERISLRSIGFSYMVNAEELLWTPHSGHGGSSLLAVTQKARNGWQIIESTAKPGIKSRFRKWWWGSCRN